MPDDTGCTVLHVDMDAFYASVEVRRDPMLRGKPVAVGGTGGRGVVASASYEARAHGIRSAMPMSRARRLCADLIALPADFAAYESASEAVMAVFRDVTPLVEPLSLDEAFLDVAAAVRRLGPPATIAASIRARIAAEQQLTCSVGVAGTKFVAKVASEHCKPDGLLVVPVADVLAFLHPLPVEVLWGVGPKTAEALHRFGLRRVADLAATPVSTLEDALGQSLGRHLHALSCGRDDRAVEPHTPDRSVGAEETFAHDIDDPTEIHRELLRLSERVAIRLREAGWVGRTVSIKVRFADFRTITRSKTVPAATDVAADVFDTACALYDALALQGVLLRLVGVRVTGLTPVADHPAQLTLDLPRPGRRDAEQAADRAARRFGSGAVRPATLVRSAVTPPGDITSPPPRSGGPTPPRP